MASIIRIKRSSVSGNPNTLAAGELAYSALTDNGSNGGDRLYIGIGTETGGNAANHFVIGGKYFTDMLDHAKGQLTASSALVVDADSKLDQLKVDNLDLNGNTLSTTNTNGDLLITPNGTGKTVVTNLYIGDTNTSLTEFIQDVTGGAVVSGNGVDVSYNDTAGTSTVSLNTEYVQDLVGAVFTGGTHSGITATYDDANGVVNLNVNDPTITIAGDVDGSATMTDLGNTTITVTLDTVNSNVGTFGSASLVPIITVNGKGLVTAVSTASISTSLNISGDTGTDTIALGTDTLAFVGGTGITSTVTNNTVTLDIDSTVATLTGTQTLTNKTISGANNTLTNIGNSSLTNSSVTIGSSSVSLGGTITSIAGLTTVTVDNLTIDGNTISSSTGDVVLSPNGSGAVDVSDSRIIGVAAPINATDAANKAYVDNAVTGLDWKSSVNLLAATNVALTGSTSTLVIDGHAALDSTDTGYRILLIGQTTASENGIYVYSDNGTTYSLARDVDADTFEELIGASVYVTEGVTYGQTGWVQTDHYLTSFSGQEWVQFAGAGAYVAGNGLTLTGTTFDVGAGDGISVTANAVSLANSVAGAGLTYTTGVLAIGGTADRITVNADSIDIASTYAGQTSLVTLGTVTTGTWNATTIGTGYGGTGLTTYATGDLLYASGTNTLAKLAAGADGKVLQMNSSGVPVWGDIDGGTY